MKKHLKNVSYVILSNLFTVLSSSLVVLILPKMMGVESYGYWQLYVFYLTYIGFFHLGWIDGVYLRYGGAEYAELDQKRFYSQTVQFSFYLLVLSLGLWFFLVWQPFDAQEAYVYQMVIVSMLVTNLRAYFIYLLQMTNRLKDSSLVLMSDRAVYLTAIISLILLGQRSFQLMIVVDLLGRTLSLFYAMWKCQELVFRPIRDFRLDVKESWDNIRVGLNLMLSNIASSMIIGLVRFGIQQRWSVATFGKVSLTLSISNLMMTFINAIGIVVFPLLRRTKKEQLPVLYASLRNALMWVMFGILFFYYPLSFVLNLWLPAYRDSLVYMALIFPMSVYEGKMALIINTYYKALRMETLLLRINVGIMLTSLLLTLVTTVWLHQLDLAVISILILLMLRSVVAEWFLSRRMAVAIKKDLVAELLMTLGFIACGYLVAWPFSILSYGVLYLLYSWVKWPSLKALLRQIKEKK